ncbi:MAG: hypothetical protein JWP97_4657 [Labilithrix sp.]|nr:hypothetical protein [Labilithrix sp.]
MGAGAARALNVAAPRMETGGLAWVLNLDADLELAAPRTYAPSAAVHAAMTRRGAVLARTLLGPDDLVVDALTAPGSARGRVGRAFCPTPRALLLLERAGATPEPAPPVTVLARVNSRAFAAALGPGLPGSVFATDLAEAERALAGTPPVGDGWRIKRAFGMTGRGQRVVRGAATGEDRAFLAASLRGGAGVQIEPDVHVVKEYGLHGLLDARGAVTWGRVVEQRCDLRGAWVATVPLLAPEPEVEGPLRAQGERVVAALASSGYFGPFGVDAFTYAAAGGGLSLQPCSEINARYSMGFPVGLGL